MRGSSTGNGGTRTFLQFLDFGWVFDDLNFGRVFDDLNFTWVFGDFNFGWVFDNLDFRAGFAFGSARTVFSHV